MKTIGHFSKIVKAIAYLVALLGYTGFLFRIAKKQAEVSGRPMLNVGCKAVYTDSSDINLDIVHRSVPNFIKGDVQNLYMFPDKRFGVVFASHVIEHVLDPEAGLKELGRVGDEVYVVTPPPFYPQAWLHPGHRWIFMGTRMVCRNPLFDWWHKVRNFLFSHKWQSNKNSCSTGLK